VGALRQFVLLESSHDAEMLTDTRQRLGEMLPARKMLGEQFFQIAKQRARLCIAFETLSLPLAVAAMRDAL